MVASFNPPPVFRPAESVQFLGVNRKPQGFNPPPVLRPAESRRRLTGPWRTVVSIRRRSFDRRNPCVAECDRRACVFQSAAGLSTGGIYALHPRQSIKLSFQSAAGLSTGGIDKSDAARLENASFNPPPVLRPAESVTLRMASGTIDVSIRRRSRDRRNPWNGRSRVSLHLFQSAAGHATGGIAYAP